MGASWNAHWVSEKESNRACRWHKVSHLWFFMKLQGCLVKHQKNICAGAMVVGVRWCGGSWGPLVLWSCSPVKRGSLGTVGVLPVGGSLLAVHKFLFYSFFFFFPNKDLGLFLFGLTDRANAFHSIFCAYFPYHTFVTCMCVCFSLGNNTPNFSLPSLHFATILCLFCWNTTVVRVPYFFLPQKLHNWKHSPCAFSYWRTLIFWFLFLRFWSGINSVRTVSETQESLVFCPFSSCKNRISMFLLILLKIFRLTFVEMNLIIPDVHLLDKQQGSFRARVALLKVLFLFYHFYLM